MSGFESNTNIVKSDFSYEEAWVHLGIDDLEKLATSSHSLDPKHPAFVWQNDGTFAKSTKKDSRGSIFSYSYKLFPDSPPKLVSTYCYQPEATTTGFYQKNGSYYESWPDNDTHTDMDAPSISWELPDYTSQRKKILSEERYRVVEHFFRPSKNVPEILTRQAAFSELAQSSLLDELLELKTGSYDTILGLKNLFSSDDYEISIFDALCRGKESSSIIGDYHEKIGEYDIKSSVDESVNLINNGLQSAKLLAAKLQDLQSNHALFGSLNVDAVKKIEAAITKVISLDGSRQATNVDAADLQSWDNQISVTTTLCTLVEDYLYNVGTPLEIARIVRDEKWVPSTFDQNKPTTYTGAWNINRKKHGHVRVDSPDGTTPIVYLSGPNTSGKSTLMETDMLLRLAAQTTGFAPALSANINPTEAFIKLERTGNLQRNDLSAYMQEIEAWNEAFKALSGAEGACIYADESFSTTSPEDQATLQRNTSKYLLKKFGAYVILATHNGITMDDSENDIQSGIVGVYHPEAFVDKKGNFIRNFKLLHGAGDSMSFDVARARNFPNDIIDIAEMYKNDTIPEVSHPIHTANIQILKYSHAERISEMTMAEGLDALFSKQKNPLAIFLSADKAGFAFECDSDIDSKVALPTGIELSVDNLIAGIDESLVNSFMESTGTQSSQQLHERQRLFHTLIENMTFREISQHIPMVMSGDFAAIELAKFSSDGFQTLNPFVGYDFIKHLERDKQNHQNIKISTITTIFAAADAYLDQHQKSFNTIDFSTIRAQLRDVEVKLFDTLPAIERTNASKNDDQDNMPDWMEELMREVPKQSQELHKLLEAINSSITAPDPRKIYTFVKESNSKHNTKFNHDTLINIGPETATLIQEMMHKISEIPFKGNKGQLLTFDELFKTADEKNLDILASFQLENQEGGTTAAGQLRTLKISERSSVELMKILHAMDSIHLRKLANALERHSSERIDAIRQGNVTKTSFEIQYEQQHPKSVAKQFFTASKNSGWHTTQLMQLQTLCHIAGGLDKAGYTPVTFNNTGVVRLENMFRKTSGSKSPIIRNPVSYDGGRAIALTGPNGSGKSFYQQSTTKAILEAHAFGYAPATTATMPIFDKVLYTDRVTKRDEDLSSFAQEIETWKTVHSIVEGSEGRVFIGIDEPFTTTSEKYQEALTYATISNLLANGKSYLSVATHNHKAIASLGQFVTPYHFKFEIGNNGFLKRHFHLEPGHAKSHAAAMARTLGFPREIVEDM